MLLVSLLLCCVRYAHKVQSYRCLSSYCLLAFSGYFHVRLIYIKRSAILRFFIVLGGGSYVEFSLRFNVPPMWTV